MLRSSLGLCLALCAATAQAQQAGGEAVAAGVTVTADRSLGPDTVVYRRSITRAGQDTSAGTRSVVRRVIAGPGGTRQVVVEQRFPWGNGEIVDTAIADLITLRAVAHRSHQPTKTMRFDFVGNDVQGSVAPAGKGDSTPPVQAVHQPLGGPIFDSNVLDLVIAALPLERGFSADLPFFIYERGGRVSMPVAVRDRATLTLPGLGPRDAWVVSVRVPDAPATIWVDTRTRAVLQVRYEITARGMAFTDQRVTPLRS